MNIMWMNLISISISAGILILFIITFRSLLMDHISKKVMVILWGIAIIRLLVPFYLSAEIPGIGNIAAKGMASLETSKGSGTMADVPLAGEAATAYFETTENIGYEISDKLLTYIWFAGMSVCMLAAGTVYLRNRRFLRQSLPCDRQLPSIDGLNLKNRSIRLYEFDRLSTPLTSGVIRPGIYLPKNMNDTEEAVGLVLCHEMIHISYLDNLWKAVSLLAVCIHWFNPLVWILYVLFNRDLELRCDEEVLRIKGEANKKTYALALISLAEQKTKGFAPGVGFGRNAVKERIHAIMKYKKLTIAGITAAVALTAVALTVFFTNGTEESRMAAEETADKQEPAAYEQLPDEKIEAVQSLPNENIDHVYLPAIKTETAGAKEETTHEYIPTADSDTGEYYFPAKEKGKAGAYLGSVSEGEAADEAEMSSAREFTAQFEQYGLTMEETENDWKFYFNGEPVFFVADNRATDGTFYGSLYSKEQGKENGTCGAVSIRDESGKITGMTMLSEKESKEYSRRWTGSRSLADKLLGK